jgi:plastocyanin
VRWLWLLSVAVGGVALAAAAQVVSQKGRAFSVSEITVAVGETVTFVNEDDFVHQIYVSAPNFEFDSDEAPPGTSIPLKFTTAGTFSVRCHIHPKMALTATVR